MIIKSPFNFVPLNSKVFFPEWANQISQDIPFSDGVSGIIDLTITAESPIYIHNGQLHKEDKENKEKSKKDDKEKKDYSFSHITTAKGNRYFIPGTSIKGEVRNVLEIMSYGKMCVDGNAQFARRDLRDNTVYPLLKSQGQELCGWLRRNGQDYEIEDHGRFWRISHPEIDSLLGSDMMRRNFSKVMVGKLIDEQKTATFKYGLIKNESALKNCTFKEIGKNRMGDTLLEYSPKGNLCGTLVFTGQPSSWTEPRDKHAKGKYYEFVFPKTKQGVRNVSKEDFDHYAFIYKDSEDWKRIQCLLDESERGGQGVPVFFIPKGNDSVEHFGMAYLYKMPYDHSVFESLPKDHQDKGRRDLAECIFGYADKQDALRGRVQFGHAFVPEGVQVKPLPRIRLMLGSPKASYYPLYVSQDGKGGIVSGKYETYDNGTPAGWKRYYVRKTNSVKKTDQDKVDTFMEPLDKGATFHGTVTFHNLRPVELGALLSALTFHHTPQCRHQLGMAKAYGYGKCRYDAKLCVTASSRAGQPKDADYFMARFEDYMSHYVAAHWTEQQPIKELFTMAGNNVANGDAFDFMTMTNEKDTNEFELAKINFEYLQRATALLPQVITPKTLCDTPEFKAEMEDDRKWEEEKKAEMERLMRLEKLRRHLVEMEKSIGLASADNDGLSRLKNELSGIQTGDAGYQNTIANLMAMIDRQMERNRQLALHQFKEAYEQRVAMSGTDKGLLNNLKAELGNLHTDDKDQQAIITGLIAEIDKVIAQMPQAGFQEAFKTAITDYKMFEARVNAGLRNLKKAGVDKLTQDDKDFGAAKLHEAYDHDDKKSPKDWAVATGRFFKRCGKTVGNDIAMEWFTKLKR